jgi:FecR protein
MNPHDTRKPSLDSIVEGIRRDEPARAEIDSASARVRAALGFDTAVAPTTTIHIESCAGFQALIPDYLAGRLPRQTAILLEDHSRECIPCRRALMAARRPAAVQAASGGAATRMPYGRWAAVAALAAVGVLTAYGAWQLFPGLAGTAELKVMRVDGSLYQLKNGALAELRPGMTIAGRDAVRTAKGSGALLQMEDGSRVEMRERTEFTVRPRRSGATIALGNGSIIVEASPQGSGHLDVRTADCLVSVKGTIFAVNHGTKGSRVSVVEGAVKVDAGGSERLLHPGDQVATSDAVSPVAVSDEIAWSKEAVRYDQLLKEFASLRKDLNARVPNPELRYHSALLDKVPAGTVVYAAIPNLTNALVEARNVFMEHVAQSDVLQAWWNQHMTSPLKQKEMDEAFDRLREFGGHLGDEVVVALVRDARGHVGAPVVMAEAKDPDALRQALAKASVHTPSDVTLSFDGSIATLRPADPKALALTGGALTGAFHDKLAQAYEGGVSWLFGADLSSLLAEDLANGAGGGDEPRARKAATLEQMGILDARYLIATRADGAAGAESRAEISFDKTRRGVAAWLAAPAPLGALDFVSPDAAFAVAAVVKRPELILAEALSWAGPDGQSVEGVTPDPAGARVLGAVRDLARSLGGDFAFALDGPVLPVPSWKVAVEVYDPASAQAGVQALIAAVNDRVAVEGHAGQFVLASENAGNRTDWVLRFTGATDNGASTVRYTFTDGYLLAAPSRALLDRAIEQRGNGYRLAASKPFMDRLPTDDHLNVSAVVWQNLAPTFQPLLSGVSSTIAVGDRKQIEAMLGEARPSLLTVYAGDDRILLGARDEAGIGSMLASLASVDSLSAAGKILGAAAHAQAEGKHAAP